MIPEIIKKWEARKHLLEGYFRNTKQDEYNEYGKIVKKIFELVINEEGDYDNEWNVGKMTTIDDGDYQGTQIFFIPNSGYQPSIEDYIITHTYYGSCSGCDTLQAIMSYDYDEKPNEHQVKEYMDLALHLVQKMKRLKDED